MLMEGFIKNYEGLDINIQFSEHAMKRVKQRRVNINYVNKQIERMAKKDILLDLEIGSRFAILDNKTNTIIVFKVLLNIDTKSDVDLLIITVIKQSKSNYFGINKIPTIDMDRELISYGFDKEITKLKDKIITREKRLMTFTFDEIDNFFRDLRKIIRPVY